MNPRKMATKLEGWNTVSDVAEKLKVRRSSVYVYLSMLNKTGYVTQKIKKPRGTAYEISRFPASYKRFGMYEDTDFIAPEPEFTKEKVSPEHKIAFFLHQTKIGGTVRNYNEALKLVKKIKNWKSLYRYLKVYKAQKEFCRLYLDARKRERTPHMPKRYKVLLGL